MSDRIDSIIDINKIGSEIDFLKNNLTEIANVIKSYPTIKTKIDGAQSVKEFSVANAKLQEELKAVESLVKQRFATDAKLITLQTDYAKVTAANRLEIQKQNKELKTQAELQNANTGSIEKARAAVKSLTDERNKLNLFTKEGQERQAKLNEQINKYNEFIRKNVDALAQQKINVGNYQGSAKLIVEAIEKEKNKLEELEKAKIRVQNAGSTFNPGNVAATRTTVTGFAGGSNVGVINNIASNAKSADDAVEQLNAEIEKSRSIVEGFSRVTAQPQFLNVAGKVGDATAELKFFTKALIDLERQGLGSSDAANELRQKLAQLTVEVSGAKAEIKALSSDTRGFDLFAGSVTFAADAMQTFAGAAVLAGASEEDTAEATKSLVAIMSVANGVKGIANELTTRGTAANKIYAFSQQQLAILTNASATAAQRFKAAMITTGFGALIVGIGLLVANFSKLKELFVGVSESQRKAALSQKALNDALDQGSYKDAVKNVNELRINIGLAKDGLISKEKVLKQYNETIGKTTGELNDLDAAEKALVENGDAYIKMTLFKAAANLALEEAAKNSLAAEQKRLKDVKEFTTETQKLSISLNTINPNDERNKKGVQETLKAAQAQKDAKIKADEEAANEQLNIAKRFQENAAKIAAKMNFNLFGDNTNDANKKNNGNKAIDRTKDNEKALLDIFIQNANERARIQKQIADDEDANIEDRLEAEYNYFTEKKNILLAQRNFEISQVGLTTKQKEAIDNKYKIDSKILEEERLKERQDLLRSYDAKLTQELKDRNDKELSDLVDKKQKEQQVLEQSYTDEIKLLNDKYQKGLITEEQFNADKEKADKNYRVNSLKIEIEYTKSVLKLMEARGVDVSKELADLAKLERDLSNETLNVVTENEGKKKKTALETIDAIEKKYNDLTGIIDSALNASATAEKNRLQEESDAIDIKKEAEIKAIEASTLSEEDKANRITVINARVQAQKEQIERKQRETAIRQAQFEKLFSIGRIGLTTGEAIMTALADKLVPYPVRLANSIYAGALGAAQLALAIATPVPRFYKGKDADNNYEGIAWVDDGGKAEAIIREDGSIEIGTDKPRLTHVGKNDIVHPDADLLFQSMRMVALNGAARTASNTVNEVNYTKEMTEQLTNELRGVRNAIANKKEMHIKPGFNSVMGIHKYGDWYTNYVNEQTNF